MEKITHTSIDVNGIKLHLAEIGNGEHGVVVFLHGFPEIWYSWRHQMIAAAAVGHRAIALDWRGYGLSQQPGDIKNNSDWSHLVSDLLGMLNVLAIPKVHLVAKDFGVKPAFMIALEHPHRVLSVASLGFPYSPFAFAFSLLPEGFYINRFGEPGRAEADFGRFDAKTVVRNVYILFSRNEIPIAKEEEEVMDMVDPKTPLPKWFSDEDLNAYASLYEKSGFDFPLHMPYRASFDELKMEDPKLKVPSMLIMGEKDYCLKFPGIEDYIRSGMINQFVPDLELHWIPEGSHFVQEQFPEMVNEFLISFFKSHAEA